MPYWEIVADNLKKRGWTYGYVSTVDSQGRTIWIVAAYRLKSIAARQSLNNHFFADRGFDFCTVHFDLYCGRATSCLE